MGLQVLCDECGATLGEEFVRFQVNWRGTVGDVCIPCFMTKTSFSEAFYGQLEREGLPEPPVADKPTAKTPKWTKPKVTK